MNELKYQEIVAMLVVIYEKLDKLEHKVKGGSRMPSSQSYLDELRQKAQSIINQIDI